MKKIASGNVHWVFSGILAVGIVPALLALGLPSAVNWGRLFPMYWIGLSERAILAAFILAAIGLPSECTLKPLWRHFMAQKPRILFFVVFMIGMIWKFGLHLGLILIALATVLGELVDRSKGDLATMAKWLRPIFPPSVYFFFGLVLVFAYNDVIATLRNPAAYDWLFLKMDSFLLRGGTVSGLAQTLGKHIPVSGFSLIENIYFSMFDQLGAGLIIVSMCLGLKSGLRYVGTLLTAYYLALALFFLWPSMGPFFTCLGHFSHFPPSLTTFTSQQGAIWKAKLLASPYRKFSRVDTDYFIAFPCLHIAQPIVTLWFLRRWRRMVWFLVAYDVLLIPAILFLEWHYIVDLLGGVLVAIVAIWLNYVPDTEDDAARANTAVYSRLPESQEMAV